MPVTGHRETCPDEANAKESSVGGEASACPVFPLPRDRACPFDPAPELARIQREDPISRVRIWDDSTPWIITRYADVQTALSEPRLSVNTQLPGYPSFNGANAVKQGLTTSLINMDEPEHSVLRRRVNPTFMFKKMEAYRPRIQQIVDDQLDELLAGPNPADLVEGFALPVPSLVICELLGVPYEHRDFFQNASTTLLSKTSDPQEARVVAQQLLDFLAELVDIRAADPGEGLLGRLIVEQLQTGNMTREELATMADLVLVAGHETTANMIALGTALLLGRPDDLAAIRDSDDPQFVADAVEELLRYLNITHFGRRRVALDDIEIDGTLIRAGEGLIVANDIANRDPDVFTNPDELDIRRTDSRQQLAFGYGIHQCLGQQMARIELQIAYQSLFRRIPTLALATSVDQLPFKADGVVYGLHSLPVTW